MNLTLEEQLQEHWKEVNKAVTQKQIPAHIPVPSHVTNDLMWQRFLDGISHIIDERIYIPQDSLSGQYSLKQFTPEEVKLWQTHWQSVGEHYEQQQRIIIPNRDIISIIYERFAPIKARLAGQYGGFLTKAAIASGVPLVLASGIFAGIAKAFSIDLPFDSDNNHYGNGKVNSGDNNSYQLNNPHILGIGDANKPEEPYKSDKTELPINPKETYNQQTGNIASIALQPNPKSAYTAQTGDGSGNSIEEKVSEPQIQIATADIPASLPLRININSGDYPTGQPVTAKLSSTGDGVLTGDVNQDGRVDIKDLQYIARNLNRKPVPSTADLYQDGVIDVGDLAIVGYNFGKSAPIPPPDPCIDVPTIDFVLNNDVIYSAAPAYTGDVKTIFDRAYCELTGYSIDRLIADGTLEIVVRDMPGRRDSEFVRRVKDNQIVGGTVYVNKTNLNVGKMLERLAKDVYGGFHGSVFDNPLPADTLTSTPWEEGGGIIYETLFMQYLQEKYNLNMILADTEQNRSLLELYAQRTLVNGNDPSTQGIRFAWAYAEQRWSADFNGPNAELNVAKLKEFKDFVNTISPMDFGPTYNPEWTSSVLVRRVSPESDLQLLGQGLSSMGYP